MIHWYVYLLRRTDGKLYWDVTTEPDRPFQEHNEGIGCRYTRTRLLVLFVWCSKTLGKSKEYKEECRIKRMSKAAKERLATGGT